MNSEIIDGTFNLGYAKAKEDILKLIEDVFVSDKGHYIVSFDRLLDLIGKIGELK
jgi:hypothetical protein